MKLLLLVALAAAAPPLAAGSSSAPAPDPSARIPVGLRCLVAAYPERLCDARFDAVVWCDGATMSWDDGRRKADHEARLADGDLEEQMSQRYPAGTPPAAPAVDFDPGRIRHEPFFRKMYGASKAAVAATLEDVEWLDGGRLRMTRLNGAADALRRVVADLRALPPDVRHVVEKASGAFRWRSIKGTDRLSMHAFGVAVDVGVAQSDYWRWRRPGPDGRYAWRNRIPVEVVSVFEKHGFVWGGRWYHFDTMHFEYRPELLHPDCRAPSGSP